MLDARDLPLGIGYSVSCGYLIDKPSENLVYMRALTRDSIRQLNSGGKDVVQPDSIQRVDSISAQFRAYKLH
jgi:hypothetical protein